jgi:predicted PurR-regulated permease PerM
MLINMRFFERCPAGHFVSGDLPFDHVLVHQSAMKSERILLLALAGALGVGCFLILVPFLPAMLWAGILVYCLWPLYMRFTKHVRPVVAAFIITLLVAGIVLVPLVHLALVAAKEARQSRGWISNVMQNGLPPAPLFLQKIPLIGSLLSDFWNNSADDLGGVASSMQPFFGTLAHSGFKLVIDLTHGLVGIVVALFIAYFFFLSGAQIIARMRLLLVRIMNENRVEHLLGLVAGTVRGVVFGIVGTAALQGVLYAIGFETAHAPQPLLLASLAGLISIVPAGAIVVYVPLCLFLLAKGHVLGGVLLLAYCFVVVGGADSIVRPWLISRGASLPYALTLVGVLGGAIAFGALGIFLGPVLLALGLAVAEEFAGQPRGAWRQT